MMSRRVVAQARVVPEQNRQLSELMNLLARRFALALAGARRAEPAPAQARPARRRWRRGRCGGRRGRCGRRRCGGRRCGGRQRRRHGRRRRGRRSRRRRGIHPLPLPPPARPARLERRDLRLRRLAALALLVELVLQPRGLRLAAATAARASSSTAAGALPRLDVLLLAFRSRSRTAARSGACVRLAPRAALSSRTASRSRRCSAPSGERWFRSARART